jgi:CheY-like chemotaxis protein
MDGEEAFNMLESVSPDLILLDLILPKRNGFEFLEMLRNDPRFNKTPVIITSNLGQDTDVERGKTFGVIEYIIKNKLSIDELVNKVSTEVKKLS